MRMVGLILWVSLISLPARGAAGDVEQLEDLVSSVQPLQVEFSAPQNAAEADAYAKKFVQTIREKAFARRLPLNQVVVYLHYIGDEVPEYLKWLVRTLNEEKIRVGERGEITRWDKEWGDLWPLKRARISEQQMASELLARIHEETSLVRDLPKFANEELASSFLDSIHRSVRMRLGMPQGMWAIAVPYLDHHTGLARPMFKQIRDLRSAAFFMTLTGVAAAVQILQRFPNDPNVNVMAGIVTAASWRFFFQYFKEAGNLRHQLAKFYNHQTGKTQPSFLWTLGSQLVDSITSAMTFQLALHGGVERMTPDIVIKTLLTSFAGSFAKIPIVQFTGRRGEEIKRDTTYAIDHIKTLLARYRSSVEAGHLSENSTFVQKLEGAQTFLSEGFYQEAEKNIHELRLLVPTLEGARSEARDLLENELSSVHETIRGCVRVANRLWWTNTCVDFAFDLLKYGSLLGVASVNYTYFALGLAGVGALYTKHLFGKTYVKGLSDIADMISTGRVDPSTEEGATRLLNAIENKRRVGKVLRTTFAKLCLYTGLTSILGVSRTTALSRKLFGSGTSLRLELIQRAIDTLQKRGLAVPALLVDLRDLALARSRNFAIGPRPPDRETAAEKSRTPGMAQVFASLGENGEPCTQLLGRLAGQN